MAYTMRWNECFLRLYRGIDAALGQMCACLQGVDFDGISVVLNGIHFRTVHGDNVYVSGVICVRGSAIEGSYDFSLADTFSNLFQKSRESFNSVDRFVDIVCANTSEDKRDAIFKQLFFSLSELPDLILTSLSSDAKREVLEPYFTDIKGYIQNIKIFAE